MSDADTDVRAELNSSDLADWDRQYAAETGHYLWRDGTVWNIPEPSHYCCMIVGGVVRAVEDDRLTGTCIMREL